MYAVRLSVVCVIIASVFCRAQAPTAELTGTIRDASGAVIAGAEVTASAIHTRVSPARAAAIGVGYAPAR